MTVDPTFTKGAPVAVLAVAPCPSMTAQAVRHTCQLSPGVSHLAAAQDGVHQCSAFSPLLHMRPAF